MTGANRALPHHLIRLQQQAGNQATAQLLASRAVAPPRPAGLIVQPFKLPGTGEPAPPGRADELANRLAHELVFTGLAKGDGKLPRRTGASAASKAQGGMLTHEQAAQVAELGKLDESRLLKLGFLLPKEAAAAAGRPEPDLEAYTPLQQMQVRWAMREELKIVRDSEGPDLSAGPSATDIELKKKPNVLAAKLLKHEPKDVDDAPGSYRDLSAAFVKKAGVHHTVVQENTRLLDADLVAVKSAHDRHQALQESLTSIDALGARGSDDVKRMTKRIDAARAAILRELHEKDAEKAWRDAKLRSDRANAALLWVVRERALIEHFYDLVQGERNALKAARIGQRARSGAGAGLPNGALATSQRAGAARMRGWVQQSKMSFDQVELKRAVTETDREHVQKNLNRLPGTFRKISGKVVGGALGGAVSFATLGLVGANVRTDDRGYVKGGMSSLPGPAAKKLRGRPGTSPLPSKGFPIRFTLLNDIRSRMVAYKNERDLRRGGFVWDRVSAGLNLFNEIVLQNVINISGATATWLTILGALLAASGIATFGASTPFGVALTALGLTLGAGGLTASAVKLAINGFRSTAALVSALWNQDAKVQNQLNARAAQTGLETLAAAGQTATSAVSLGMYGGNVGGVFDGMSDATKVAMKGGKVAGTQAVGLGTGAGAAGISAAASKLNAAYTAPAAAPAQDASRSRKQRMAGKLRDEFGPNAGNRIDIAGPAGSQVDRDDEVPAWMRSEVAAENKIRRAALASRTEVAKGEAQWVSTRASELKAALGKILGPLRKVLDKLPGQGDKDKVEGVEELGGIGEIMEQAMEATGGVASDLTPDLFDDTGGA